MRTGKPFVAILLTQLSFMAVKAQRSECGKIVDTFFYVTVDIRSARGYPVTMSGVGKTALKEGDLSVVGVDSFLQSFYREYKYVPDPVGGYGKIQTVCGADSPSAGGGKEGIARFVDRTSRLAIHRKIRLQSGETVFMDITRVGGVFWKIDSRSPALSSSSNEYPISKITEFSECYFPDRIGFYQKPKPGEWK